MDMIALHASGMISHSYFSMVNKVLPLPGNRTRPEWIGEPVRLQIDLRLAQHSASLAKFAAIRRASSRVSRLAAER